MSKLYIFGIGGTGSRVLRSLTMLLAAGVECGVDTIVPIIIDRDIANQDLTRTKFLIEDYIEVNKIAGAKKNEFFKTKIALLNNELCLQLTDNTQEFANFIGRSTMSKENQALVDMLFSEDTLKLDMTQGFQGNPNIGSIVLNQFDNSNVFKDFANDFKNGDKIFIISSIFGGTGASGFPLLRKTLQTPNVRDAGGQVFPNWGLINDALIGAISVLPYFTVQPATDGSLVNSDTFTDKAKAALSYYKTEDKMLDTLYYIADMQTTTYAHHIGGNVQKNDAHFIELAAALAILDFADPQKESRNIHRDNNGKIVQTTYKEFGIDNQSTDLNFDNLADETKKLIVNPLSRFLLFHNYMTHIFNKQSKHQPYAHKRFTADGFRGSIKELEDVQSKFHEWLQEMERQNRKFSPFNLFTENALDFIKGNISVIQSNDFRYKNWATLDNALNQQIRKVGKASKKEQFIELFYLATKELIN